MAINPELTHGLKAAIVNNFMGRERGEWVNTSSPGAINQEICNEFLPLFNPGITSPEQLGQILEDEYGAELRATAPELILALTHLLLQGWEEMSPELKAPFGPGGLEIIKQLKASRGPTS
ncbi:MAG: hypothetical protein HYS86_03850 [Candidatus Chisholmbacteria bacterium]|nr:hypothetical protein [Candidatus Chisholmbacteria bacterium]